MVHSFQYEMHILWFTIEQLHFPECLWQMVAHICLKLIIIVPFFLSHAMKYSDHSQPKHLLIWMAVDQDSHIQLQYMHKIDRDTINLCKNLKPDAIPSFSFGLFFNRNFEIRHRIRRLRSAPIEKTYSSMSQVISYVNLQIYFFQCLYHKST